MPNANAQVADVIVVGSGSAALMAALTAADAGSSVIVLEKTPRLGGTTAMSGGALWFPANHMAAQAGVKDSTQEALAYMRATGPEGWDKTEDELWQAFCRNSPEAFSFLSSKTNLKFDFTDEEDVHMDAPGAKKFGRMLSPLPISRWRLGLTGFRIRRSTLPQLYTYQETVQTQLYHRPVATTLKLLPKLAYRFLTWSAAKGTGLIVGLLEACRARNCQIHHSTRVVELVYDDKAARVSGVVAEREGKQLRFEARKGVILATGGFEWNEELFAKYFPGKIEFLNSPRTNTGDGHVMGARIGAALAHMTEMNATATLPTRYEGQLHGMPVPFHSYVPNALVNGSGSRFVDEKSNVLFDLMNERTAEGRFKHDPVWLITDKRVQGLVVRWYASYKKGWMREAGTIDELARMIGCDAGNVRKSIDEINAKAKDEQGRIKAPYVLMPFNRGVLGTKGGLRTDGGARVLREDGSVINGLFAAGLTMANPIGSKRVSHGTTLGPNLTWGFIAAKSALARN